MDRLADARLLIVYSLTTRTPCELPPRPGSGLFPVSTSSQSYSALLWLTRSSHHGRGRESQAQQPLPLGQPQDRVEVQLLTASTSPSRKTGANLRLGHFCIPDSSVSRLSCLCFVSLCFLTVALRPGIKTHLSNCTATGHVDFLDTKTVGPTVATLRTISGYPLASTSCIVA